MRNFLITIVAFAAMATTVGCGHARTSVEHPGLSISTFSYNPEEATRAAADAHVRSYNAETYRIAVESGMAFPYYGGGYGNDYWYHYRGIVPAQPMVAAPPTATGTTAVPGDHPTRSELDAVRERAPMELLETREIRDDGKGRHTTTRRELVQLPGGGLVIDTPGMREVQLWIAEEGLEEAFSDVTELFEHCRFSDCAHESEPGCAVKEAIANGTLAPERWESYLKLQRELAHLERRLDKRAQAEERKRWRALSTFAREASRAKRR